MTVDKCKRIMWRLQEKNNSLEVITYCELRNAIVHECGTDSRTIKAYVATLIMLGWLKRGEQMATFTATNKGKTR